MPSLQPLHRASNGLTFPVQGESQWQLQISCTDTFDLWFAFGQFRGTPLLGYSQRISLVSVFTFLYASTPLHLLHYSLFVFILSSSVYRLQSRQQDAVRLVKGEFSP